ncbi:MAG: hypothetical protein ACREVH_03390 [Gammaproteobacteria bacterium]
MELPEANPDFLEAVKRIFSVTQSEAYFTHLGQYVPAYKTRKRYWEAVFRRLRQQKDYAIRRFPQVAGERFYRDLRYMLRRDLCDRLPVSGGVVH